jgi:hypothetical protein
VGQGEVIENRRPQVTFHHLEVGAKDYIDCISTSGVGYAGTIPRSRNFSGLLNILNKSLIGDKGGNKDSHEEQLACFN